MSFRPNYRRARALFLEIEAARNTLDELRGDPTAMGDAIAALVAERDRLRERLEAARYALEPFASPHTPQGRRARAALASLKGVS